MVLHNQEWSGEAEIVGRLEVAGGNELTVPFMGSLGLSLSGLTQKGGKKAFQGGDEGKSAHVLYFILMDLNGCGA